jgi:DNA-binding response OmpR family regulator
VPEKKRILIVDDEVVIADSLAKVFSREGYESKGVYTPEEAVEVVSEWTPHLAIIDVKLKGTNGVGFAIMLREKFPNCEVALFTGLTDLSDLLGIARDAGHSFEVITKPISPKEILDFVSLKLSDLGDGEFSLA